MEYIRKEKKCGSLWLPFVNDSRTKKKFRDESIKNSKDPDADSSFAWNDLIGVDSASLMAAYGGKNFALNTFEASHHVKIETKWSINLITALPDDKNSIPNGPTETTVAKKGAASKAKARLVLKAVNESVEASLGDNASEGRKRSSRDDVTNASARTTGSGDSGDADGAERPPKRKKSTKPSISKEAAMVCDAIARLGPKDMEWVSSSLVGQLASMIRDGRKATASADGEGESTKFCPSTELHTLACEVINAVTDAHSGFATLEYKDASDKSRSVTYLKLFKPSKKEAEDLVQRGGFAAVVAKRAKSVTTLMSHYDDACDADTGKSLLAKVAKDLEYTVFKASDWELPAHVLEAHVVAFIERYEAHARFGEEGFESSHPHIKKIKELLKTIGSVECRTSNLSRRMSTSLDPKQQKLSSRIRTFKEGKPRPGGCQTKRTANDTPTASGVIGSSGNIYFSVGKDAILPEHWREAFELCEYGRAPAAWREIFVSDNDLDGSQKIKAEYTSHK